MAPRSAAMTGESTGGGGPDWGKHIYTHLGAHNPASIHTQPPRPLHRSTPLLLAAMGGHTEAVELLLRSPGVCTRKHLNRLRRNQTSLLWSVRQSVCGWALDTTQ